MWEGRDSRFEAIHQIVLCCSVIPMFSAPQSKLFPSSKASVTLSHTPSIKSKSIHLHIGRIIFVQTNGIHEIIINDMKNYDACFCLLGLMLL